ncbi:MAG: DNA-methyltransferase [Candidatus Hodarchaeota archaeon]
MKKSLVSDNKPVIHKGDCLQYFKTGSIKDIDLTFFDPPYNQGKDYEYFDDEQNPEEYWTWIKKVLKGTYNATVEGGAIYFMQREKNAEFILRTLRETKWTYQNTIIWKKQTSAVPGRYRFGKSYQVIAFATKGKKPRVFNRLRIDPPLPPHYKYKRKNGMYATDIWVDIKELTSGYFAGEEPLRDKMGNRIHKQQSPVALLTRIILSSSLPGDTVFDPMAGTGTTLVTACQLGRKSIGIEIDPSHVNLIKKRLEKIKRADSVSKYYKDYQFTPNLDNVWGIKQKRQHKPLV